MPWSIKKKGSEFCVVKDGTDEVEGCHTTRDEAAEQIRALYASEEDFQELPVEAVPEEHLTDMQEIASELRRLADVLVGEHHPELETIPELDIETPSPEVDYAVWQGPVTFENQSTGDGRTFLAGSVTWDASLLPFPFKWQRVSDQGHLSSIVIGRVDSLERLEDGVIWGRGVILQGPGAPPEAYEYIDLLKADAVGGVSIDGDDAVFNVIEDEEDPYNTKMEFSRINIRALTAVDIPAFAGAKIKLTNSLFASVLSLSELVDEVLDENNVENDEFSREISNREGLGGLIAGGIPINPSEEWYVDPKFTELTALTITDDGRVFGHICGKETCHIGFGTCRTSPRNCDYDAYFHLGQIPTAEGGTVNVGHMTFGGGHAPLELGAQAAAAVYDSTSRVSADIRAGEDEFGTWVVGALRPGLSLEDVREIRSAPISGDWRPIKNKLQLIAAHAVNVPGFPIPRAKVLVASGETQTVIITEECYCNVEKAQAEEFSARLFQLDLEEINE